MAASSPLDALVDALLRGEVRALSRLISRVEGQVDDVVGLMGDFWSKRGSGSILGVTGPPGCGKSTLVDRIVAHHREAGRSVAVLAVDPSSPFTGGAILGDRIRMQRHAVDPGVFIRSLGTRGHHGGLTRTSLEAALLCLAAGFERVVVETVGVGQTELEIAGIADQVLVVLVPEAGDVVQTLKAGLLEGADILAVNKADRPGSDALVRELRASVGHGVELGSPSIPVHSISAREGEGVLALLDEVEGRLVAGIVGNRRLSPASFVARIVGQERGRRAASAAKVALAEGGALQDVGEALSEGRTNPYAAVLRVLETLP